jgi:uncharacterized membrane protein (UPF0127 family)
MASQHKLIYTTPDGRKISVEAAYSFKKRFFGLMGRKEGDYGLLLYPCNSIHTFFMRYTLDAVYLDLNNNVVAVKRSIRPTHATLPVRGAAKVLEFPSGLGLASFFAAGERISLIEIIQ